MSMESSSLSSLFSAGSRLYALEGEGALGGLQVEAWTAREALSSLPELRVLALSDDASLDLDDMVSRPVTLWTTGADGERSSRSGLVRAAERVAGDGGLARYRLTVVPWLWLADQTRASRIFEGRPVLDILTSILDAYEGYSWKLSGDASAAVAELPVAPYVTQYRETDYAFLTRVMAGAGLGWTVVEDTQAPSRHAIVVFADSRQLPEDASSSSVGVPFHRANAAEARDGVQAFARQRRRVTERVTLLGWQGGGKRAVSGDASGEVQSDSGEAEGLEWYDFTGHGSLASEDEARRQAELLWEGFHAEDEQFLGRGTVRSFRSGTRFTLKDMAPLGPAGEKDFEPVFALDAVEHVGINNLPEAARASLDARLGPLDAALNFDAAPAAPVRGDAVGAQDDDALWRDVPAETPAEALLTQARATGYANGFRALRCDRAWRPRVSQARGAWPHAAPTVHGVQTAVVVDAEGSDQAGGKDEVLRNRRGDVRIRFPWQGTGGNQAHSRWARVAQRQAGGGMGMTFVPRIGQEVLVRFLDHDVNQPIVVGALYNGRGEGGVAPTPAGAAGEEGGGAELYAAARDLAPSAQANLVGGHAPAWHGAGASDEAHRNAAALSGFKSKEFGGAGYSQVVLDDSDDQLRVHVSTTQAATSLTLGHLIHQAGNYRGSLRGVGAELRTDAHGALRGGAGVLLTTYAAQAGAPSGEAAGAQTLASQAHLMAKSLDDMAGAHQSVRLASALGTEQAGASRRDPEYPPLAAFHRAVSGTVAGEGLSPARGDAASRHTQAVEGKVPHTNDAVVVMAARAGLAQVAGQHMQYVAGDAVHASAGKDVNHAVAGSLRIHAGQAAGVVAGVQKGAQDAGLDVICATADVSVQAQGDVLTAQAQQDILLTARAGKVKAASPTRIRIATAAGASILIEGGNITVTAPGRIDVKMSDKRFEGATRLSEQMNTWPDASFDKDVIVRGPSGKAMANRPFEIVREDGARIQGVTDAEGRTGVQRSELLGRYLIKILPNND
ncbi:VgrG protein [plant metagenome]|uniref:VgrG protein n=1 Tax=plant metagenome TaxID=1297885 RepID=A0A484V453_9ZZZZ